MDKTAYWHRYDNVTLHISPDPMEDDVSAAVFCGSLSYVANSGKKKEGKERFSVAIVVFPSFFTSVLI